MAYSWLGANHHLSWDSCSHTFPSLFLGIAQKYVSSYKTVSSLGVLWCKISFHLFPFFYYFSPTTALHWLKFDFVVAPLFTLSSSWLFWQSVSCRPRNYTHRSSPCKICPVIAASSMRQREMWSASSLWANSCWLPAIGVSFAKRSMLTIFCYSYYSNRARRAWFGFLLFFFFFLDICNK